MALIKTKAVSTLVNVPLQDTYSEHSMTFSEHNEHLYSPSILEQQQQTAQKQTCRYYRWSNDFEKQNKKFQKSSYQRCKLATKTTTKKKH